MKDYKKESFLAPLFKLLEATFELIVPLVIVQIIDVGIQTGDTGQCHHGAVFCRKGCRGLCHRAASQLVPKNQRTLLLSFGPCGHFHAADTHHK